MGTRLFVGNLPYNLSEDDLRQVFAEQGVILQNVRIALDRETGRPRGFAFVEADTEDNARKAIATLSGREIQGRKIHVEEAQERPGGRPGGGGGAFRGGPPSDGGFRNGPPGGGGLRGGPPGGRSGGPPSSSFRGGSGGSPGSGFGGSSRFNGPGPGFGSGYFGGGSGEGRRFEKKEKREKKRSTRPRPEDYERGNWRWRGDPDED